MPTVLVAGGFRRTGGSGVEGVRAAADFVEEDDFDALVQVQGALQMTAGLPAIGGDAGQGAPGVALALDVVGLLGDVRGLVVVAVRGGSLVATTSRGRK